MKIAVNWIVGILLLVSLILNSILVYHHYNQSAPEVIEIHDTTIIRKDSIVEKIKYKTKFDTIIDIQLKDTLIHDTIEIPIEHKVSEFNLNKDSFELKQKIHHSGFHSVIDSVECSYSFNYEVKPPKPKKIGLVWNVGLYTGYGINFNNGQYYFSPEVGVGASIGIGGIIK